MFDTKKASQNATKSTSYRTLKQHIKNKKTTIEEHP